MLNPSAWMNRPVFGASSSAEWDSLKKAETGNQATTASTIKSKRREYFQRREKKVKKRVGIEMGKDKEWQTQRAAGIAVRPD